MMANITGLKCGDFVHTIGDAHIYTNHVEPLKEQVISWFLYQKNFFFWFFFALTHYSMNVILIYS
jgi:thymidylate synthase